MRVFRPTKDRTLKSVIGINWTVKIGLFYCRLRFIISSIQTRNCMFAMEKIDGKNLLVGTIGCEKSSFVQKIGLNNLFGNLKKAEWVLHIELSVSCKVEIQSCFEMQLNFYYLSSVDDLDEPLLYFKKSSTEDNDSSTSSNNDNKNIFGEKEKMDRFIVMDNVFGLANKSNNFAGYFNGC